MSVNTKFLLEAFRYEYNTRLNQVIGEAEVFDDEGNIILSPDLKVRHKSSGLEYTIDRVEGAEGDVQIFLRAPEEPRFDPQPEGAELLGEPRVEDILGEQDPMSDSEALLQDVPDESSEETVFVIDQKEFEKEYEVD